MTKSLPRWDLSDLFSGLNDSRISKILRETPKAAAIFAKKYKGNLVSLTPAELNVAYIELESMMSPFYKLSQYVSLLTSVNTADDEAKALESQVDDIGSKISNQLVFFDLELGAMSDADFQKFKDQSALKTYAYSLEMTRKTAKHNLTEKEEKIINLKDLTGSDAFQKLYSDFTSSFEFEFEIDGKKKKMNGSELRNLRHHKDPKVRARAMKLFFSRYEDNELVLTQTFNNIIKDHNIERKLRNYKDAISVRNINNDLSDEVIDVLHQVTTESYALVHRYYKIKSKLINMPKMSLADIYAPLPTSDKKYTWDQAVDLVFEGFKAFDQEYYEMAKRMFDENRVDAPVEPKKRGGAFCSSSSPDIGPYVLLNFLGKPRDVATIAHEIGHAIHAILSSKQTLTNYHAILPLCETASVFSEMLITDLLLKSETDPLAKQSLLTEKLEDIFATSHRQNMFSRFEIQTHKQITNKIMSSKELCQLYQKELKLMFGDSVSYPKEYQWEWSSIPHIFEWPFYVYSYNFANLLVIALYQQYLEQGQTFVPKFKELLSMGSATSPDVLTAIVGADISNPDFWRKSLDYISGMIDQLDALIQ